VQVECPRFVPNSPKTIVLEEIAAAGLKSGLFVANPASQYTLKPMLVGKFEAAAERAGVPTPIRMCGDFPPLNATIDKAIPMNPHVEYETVKLENKRFYCSLDASGQYRSFILSKKSRDASCVWFPWKCRITRLSYQRPSMGGINANAIAQGAFNRMFQETMGDAYHGIVCNSADDVCFGADTIDEPLEILEEVLRVLALHHVMIKPSKISFGHEYVDFWGVTYRKEGTSPSARNLNPARRMRVPVNISELRSILGYLNQFGRWLGPPSE
jgi:hypothetical protein